jgi:hypothetical protein
LRELLRKTLLGSEPEHGEARSDSLGLNHPEFGT